MSRTDERFDLDLLRKDYILAQESESSASRIMAGFLIGVGLFAALTAFVIIAQMP